MSDFFQSLDLTSVDDNFSRRLKESNGANQDLGTGDHQASLARLAEDTIFKEGLMITCVQGFFEKMGWHTSSDPRRWEGDVRRNEAEIYKQVRKTNSFCGLL